MGMKPECKQCKYYLSCVFKKPTIQQCADYAKEIGFTPFDAEGFWWKQESLGWIHPNGTPYKSWKGIIQTWFKASIRRGDIKPPQKTFVERMRENEGQI
jgi:hypothetical protein